MKLERERKEIVWDFINLVRVYPIKLYALYEHELYDKEVGYNPLILSTIIKDLVNDNILVKFDQVGIMKRTSKNKHRENVYCVTEEGLLPWLKEKDFRAGPSISYGEARKLTTSARISSYNTGCVAP